MRSRPVHRRLGGPLALAAALLVLGSACTVGPDYVRPSMWSPDAYKEIDGWKIAHPRDDLARGPWWEIFADPQLTALEARVTADISSGVWLPGLSAAGQSPVTATPVSSIISTCVGSSATGRCSIPRGTENAMPAASSTASRPSSSMRRRPSMT